MFDRRHGKDTVRLQHSHQQRRSHGAAARCPHSACRLLPYPLNSPLADSMPSPTLCCTTAVSSTH